MFCKNCGTQMPDEAVACPNCGSQVNAQANNQAAQNVAADNSATGNTTGTVGDSGDSKGNKNVIVGVAIIVVAIIAVIFIVSKLFGGGYKDPVKDLVKMCNAREEDSSAYSKINAPDYQIKFSEQYTKLLENSDYDEDSKDYYEYIFDSWEESYGEDFKVKVVDINDVEKIDKDDLKDYQEDLREIVEDKDDIEDMVEQYEETMEFYEDEYDLSSKDSKKIVKAYEKMLKSQAKVKVTKGYEMDIKIKISGDEGEAEYKEKHVEVIKVNGDWIFKSSHTPSTLDSGFEEE